MLTIQALTTFDLFASIPVNRVKKYEIMHMPDDEPISEAPIDWAFDRHLGMETCKDFWLHVDMLLDFHRMELDHPNLEMLLISTNTPSISQPFSTWTLGEWALLSSLLLLVSFS